MIIGMPIEYHDDEKINVKPCIILHDMILYS